MTWCDDILGEPGPGASESYQELFARARKLASGLTIAELRRAWRAVAECPYNESSPATRSFDSYFDSLGAEDPERACDFILACVADEPDDALVALIGQEKLLGQLLYFKGEVALARLAPVAAASARLRWLLGACFWTIKGIPGENDSVRTALMALADQAAWKAWAAAREPAPCDLVSLSIDELAALWIDVNSRSPLARKRDRLAAEIFDITWNLARDDRPRTLELVRSVLARTEDQALLGLLSAGLLEDIVCAEDEAALVAIETQAAADPRFRALLHGVWYPSASESVRLRMDRARDEA